MDIFDLILVIYCDGRNFHPAFDHIGDIPTSASVGCSSAFNISSTHGSALFLFGGQEDWRNTNDIKWGDTKTNFSNRLFRLDVDTGSWKEIYTKGADGRHKNVPCPRSQSFIFVRKDQLYVYGGYNGLKIFSDMYRLDLSSLEWNRIDSDSLHRPNEFTGNHIILSFLLSYCNIKLLVCYVEQ